MLNIVAEYEGRKVNWSAALEKYPVLKGRTPASLMAKANSLRVKVGDAVDEKVEELLESIGNAVRRHIRSQLKDLEKENAELRSVVETMRRLLK